MSDLCLDLQKIGINAEIEKLENKMINEMSDNAFKDLVDKKNELKSHKAQDITNIVLNSTNNYFFNMVYK